MCRQEESVAPAATEMECTESTTTTTRNDNTNRITFAQLNAHNTPKSAWASVHGKVIDITDFAKRHPGGEIILLAAGKDATVLVETYHPRGMPNSIIDKLQIGTLDTTGIPPSYYTFNSPFYQILKKRVLARLEERNLSRRGSYEIWIKAMFILSGFWFSLYQMYTSPIFTHACLWSMIMGVFAHFVGTCIQHDGNHGAFAKSGWVNVLAGWTMDMIGASAFTWQFQHMLGHHPYTNVLDINEEINKENGSTPPSNQSKDQESDPDVFSSFPLMRMHPYHTPEWYHRYQHIYAPFLFAFMTLAKVFQQDIEVVRDKKLYHIDAHCVYGSKWNVFRFWFMKIITAGYMMGLPCYFHGFARGLALFVLGHMTCGEVLATMFIVNHVIEGVAFGIKGGKDQQQQEDPKPVTAMGNTPMEETVSIAMSKMGKDDEKTQKLKIPLNDWAAVQCQTSVNWAPGSWLWNHISGGLSHQIEHHLFPSLCHTTYVYIQDVVEETCIEYGVPYQSEPSLFTAYGKMISHLKFMGREKSM
jgi:fatty acid desaturase